MRAKDTLAFNRLKAPQATALVSDVQDAPHTELPTNTRAHLQPNFALHPNCRPSTALMLTTLTEMMLSRLFNDRGPDMRFRDTLDMDIALCLLFGKLVVTKSTEIKRRHITW